MATYSRADSGYAFVILLASFWGHFLQYGVVWTVGVFYVVFLENLEHNGRGEVALISSLNTAVFYGTGKFNQIFG
jgi:fatty acid desaturase